MIEAFQILVVALTIWFEARGEGIEGMRLVADTIHNRAQGKSEQMMNTVLKPRQYSCWDHRDPARADVPDQTTDTERSAWQYCMSLARLLVRGSYEPATSSTYYWRRDAEMKAWQYELEIVVEYRNHIFAKVRQ